MVVHVGLARRIACVALFVLGGCGRVGVDLIPVSLGELCIEGTCAISVNICQGAEKPNPGICGCATPDTADADGDGTPDCNDMCPGMPDRLPSGQCGCAAAMADNDGDGISNCQDQCPNDVAKKAPQICGCGSPDVDSDGDGMPDCVDECPSDAKKVAKGTCGCGVPESTRDVDHDGKLDCVDLCNGVDDARYVPNSTCGTGYCALHTTPSSCSNGVETDCQPGAPLSATDATCDGVDDNCNGSNDENFVGMNTSCGIGACATTGSIVCKSGAPTDSCLPKPPAANDSVCGGDDDCDGKIDEDFVPHQSTCGTGVCASTGTLTCTDGVASDTCKPGTPTATKDTTCNGVDENCNGNVDEDYAVTSTACGVGACSSMGQLMCIAAATVDSCMVMTGSATDTTCNGIDDNCNGTKDEGYTPVASACGVGACKSTGTVTCVAGKTSDSCKAGTPGATDTTCNGIDENCNNQVDEGYVNVVSTCGLGVCKAAGLVTCSGGKTSDSCKAGTTTLTKDGPPANGLDDDCDGLVDEDACTAPPTSYVAGAYNNIAVPAGCGSATVELWGGGGGSGGKTSVGSTGTPGAGGPGGYATAKLTLSGAFSLYVGGGGAGCGNGGANAGAATYKGGDGGDNGGGGSNGADGSVAGGGAGATTGTGNGGKGYFGGGGGGSGALLPWPPYPGSGGGGGAATVALVGGTRMVVAGGGGGGGGANGSSVGSTGGAGGSGCGAAGAGADAGGGGGGGMCMGTTTTKGTGTTPALSSELSGGKAAGAGGDCSTGGDGYAIVHWGP